MRSSALKRGLTLLFATLLASTGLTTLTSAPASADECFKDTGVIGCGNVNNRADLAILIGNDWCGTSHAPYRGDRPCQGSTAELHPEEFGDMHFRDTDSFRAYKGCITRGTRGTVGFEYNQWYDQSLWIKVSGGAGQFVTIMSIRCGGPGPGSFHGGGRNPPIDPDDPDSDATGGNGGGSSGYAYYNVTTNGVSVGAPNADCANYPSSTNCSPTIDTINTNDQFTPHCQKQGQTVGQNPYWVYGSTNHGKTGWIPSWWINYVDNYLPGVPVCHGADGINANAPRPERKPTVIVGSDGNLQAFARGSGNSLRYLWMDRTNGVWHDWGSLNTNLAGDPSAVVGSDGNTVVITRGTDNTLRLNWMNKNDGMWSQSQTIAGNIAGDPIVQKDFHNNLQVFARGTDGSLRYLWMNKDNGLWTTPMSINTAMAGDPAAVVGNDGNSVVLSRGTDGKLRLNWMNKDTGVWSGSQIIASNIAGDPAVHKDYHNNLQVFVRGTDKALRSLWMDRTSGVWHDSGSLNSNVAGAPAVVLGGDGNSVVLTRGTNGALRLNWQDKSTGQWSASLVIAGDVAGDPTLVRGSDGNLVTLLRGADATLRLHWMNKNDGTWSGSQMLANNMA